VQLNGSTFVLEIINFLILVWILQHFLYKPVLNLVARRRAAVEKTVADAHALQQDADALKRQYEARAAQWAAEHEAARAALADEIAAERARQLGHVRAELEQERQRADALEQRRMEALRRRLEQAAVETGAQFAARLLRAAAAPELEQRLITLLLEGLPTLPAEQRDGLRAAAAAAHDVAVVTAYPLDDGTRRSMERAFETALGAAAAFRYAEDRALGAGARVTIGPWVLRANLEDDLAAFAEFAHGA